MAVGGSESGARAGSLPRRDGEAVIKGVSQPGASPLRREKNLKQKKIMMEAALHQPAGVLAGLGRRPRKVWSFPVTR